MLPRCISSSRALDCSRSAAVNNRRMPSCGERKKATKKKVTRGKGFCRRTSARTNTTHTLMLFPRRVLRKFQIDSYPEAGKARECLHKQARRRQVGHGHHIHGVGVSELHGPAIKACGWGTKKKKEGRTTVFSVLKSYSDRPLLIISFFFFPPLSPFSPYVPSEWHTPRE